MNKQRKQAIQEVLQRISDINDTLNGLRDEEQGYFDNMPESLQGSDRGVKVEEYISFMEGAIGFLNDAMSELEGIIE